MTWQPGGRRTNKGNTGFSLPQNNPLRLCTSRAVEPPTEQLSSNQDSTKQSWALSYYVLYPHRQDKGKLLVKTCAGAPVAGGVQKNQGPPAHLVPHGKMYLGAVEGGLEDARPSPEAQLLHDVRTHLRGRIFQANRSELSKIKKRTDARAARGWYTRGRHNMLVMCLSPWRGKNTSSKNAGKVRPCCRARRNLGVLCRCCPRFVYRRMFEASTSGQSRGALRMPA